MTPPFACFPVCMTFVSLAIVGVIMVLAGAGRDETPPAGDAPRVAPLAPPPDPGSGPPPWWGVVLIFLAVIVVMALLSRVSGD